jgi:hypothetical protein
VAVAVAVELMAKTEALVVEVADIPIPMLLVALLFPAKVSLGELQLAHIAEEWLAVVALVRLEILLVLVATAGS